MKEYIEQSKKDASLGRKKILLFVSTPGPFLLPVEPADVDGILVGIFPGERAGEALAGVKTLLSIKY